MLMRTDPFREIDRLTQQLFANSNGGSLARPLAMPMDAYRQGDEFVVSLDLPGVDPDAIELDVERNVLTIKVERPPLHTAEGVEMQVAERPVGVFTRQLFLGDSLATDEIAADYNSGVLTLRIPVAEKAKPRRISVKGGEDRQEITA